MSESKRRNQCTGQKRRPQCELYRAGNETRTRDLLHGKQMLYQLSYSRKLEVGGT